MKKYLPLIAACAACVIVTLLVVGFFGKARKSEKMIRNEILLEQYEKEYPKIVKELEESDRKFDSLKSASDQRLNELENKKAPLIIRYEKIPATVNSLDKNELRIGTDNF